jgi:predicted HicB family RNase H-like nuclease
MNDKPKKIEMIPDEFDSYEEAAEFWDTHDTTDYLDNLESVSLQPIELRQRHFEVEVDADLMKVLYEKAKQQGIGVRQLVNDMLRETFGNVA